MEFLKNQRKGFFVYIIAAVMAVISLGVYVSNVLRPYYEDMNISVVLMILGALLLMIIAIVLPQIVRGIGINIIVDISRVAAAVLIIWAAVTFIGMRLESFGYIFASNLELGNEEAFSAGNQAVTGIILLVITWIISVAAAFLSVGKKSLKQNKK
jgi:hypothetical protein